jgi:carbonic anhydrase
MMAKAPTEVMSGKCTFTKTHDSLPGTVWNTKKVETASAIIEFKKIIKVFKEPPKLDIPLREFIDYVPQDNMVMYQGSMTEPSCEENVTWLINMNA